MEENLVVMGIDLAANPANPSATCILEGRRFRALRHPLTDDEIVQLAYREAPAVIAIDAPLTPPMGLAGSYSSRIAEVHLREAGFKALPPSRIPSLTFRGMRLALRLQRHPVIEVFPRATLERLGHTFQARKTEGPERERCATLLARHAQGLPALQTDHEVDAVAAALTAALHLEGRTEAFGASGEGQVWVPQVSAK